MEGGRGDFRRGTARSPCRVSQGTPGKPIFGCRGRRKVSTAGGAVARKNTLPKVHRLGLAAGGWKRQKISASFFRCWQFLDRLKRANYEEALDLYGRNDV